MSGAEDILGGSPYRLRISAELARVAEVREWVGSIGRVAGLAEGRVFDLKVATSEAIANGIEHAASEVEVVAWVLPDRLLVEVTNDGVFQPGLYKDDQGRRRGLGLPLMVSLADQVHVSRLPGERTRVSLTFARLVAPVTVAAATAPLSGARWLRGGLGWLLLPLPLLIVAVLAFWGTGLSAAHDSQGLLTAFNTLFVSAACLAVAYFAAFSYAHSGSPAVLLLGTGSVAVAFGFLLAGPLLSEPNAVVTVHNVSVLVAGSLFAGSGLLAVVRRGPAAARGSTGTLGVAYALAVALMLVVAVLAIADLLPAFVVPGEGYSALRKVVLGLALAAFLVAAVCYPIQYRRQASRFVMFASGAFACFCVGLGVLLIAEPSLGSAIDWAGRAGQWMGGLYLLAAIYGLQRSASSVLALERTLVEVEDRYRVLVNTSPEAILVHSGGRYVFVNPAAVVLLRADSAADLVGEEVRRFFHPETAVTEWARIDQAYAGGMSPPAESRLVCFDGTAFHAEVSRSQIRWGGQVAIQTVIRDVTERKETEARLEFDRVLLAGIAAIFEEATTDHDEEQLGHMCLQVAERITQSAIGFVGELGLGGKLYDVAISNPGWELCQVLDGHGNRRSPGQFQVHGVYGEVLLTGESLIANQPAAHPASVGFPAGHPPLSSFLGVPLKKHGRTTGMIAVGNRPGGYGRDQREKLEALAPVVVQAFDRKRADAALRDSEEKYRALAEENERLYHQQLSIAETLQQALINIPSQIGRVRLGHLYRSATEAAWVGGDFYDVFEVKDGQIVLLIGDVSGHGIEAARTATLVKDVVHAFTHQSLRTHEVLRRTNKLLVEKRLPGFVTLFLAVLDSDTGVLRYSSAGHPESLLRRASGEVEVLPSGSAPLGVFPDGTWKPRSVDLQAGDLLVMYTDGIIEARKDGDFFGEERLTDLTRRDGVPVEQLPALVLDEVLAFSGGTLKDDVALLAVSLVDEAERGARRAYRQESLLS